MDRDEALDPGLPRSSLPPIPDPGSPSNGNGLAPNLFARLPSFHAPPAPAPDHPNPIPAAILGIPFDGVTPDEATRLTAAMVASGKPHHVVLVDLDLALKASRDIELRQFIYDADLVLATDPLLLHAARILGHPLPGTHDARDLAARLLKDAARLGWSVFALAGPPATHARALAGIAATHPDLDVSGAATTPGQSLLTMDHFDLRRRIRAARADVVLVALDSPRQEKWIGMNTDSIKAPLCVGVGEDGLPGSPHPPRLRRRLRRWGRQFWTFAWAITQEWWLLRRCRCQCSRGVAARTPSQASVVGAVQLLKAPSSFIAASVHEDEALWRSLLAARENLVVDLSGVECIDSTGVGLLIRLLRGMRATRRQLVAMAPSPIVRRVLGLLQFTEHLPTAPDLASALRLMSSRDDDRLVVVTLGVGVPDRHEPIAWQGEITAANADQVWRMTEAHLQHSIGRHGGIAINLADLRFVDSAGVSVMLRARKFATRNGLDLKFSQPQPAVLQVIRLLQLDDYLLRHPPKG